MQMLAAMAMVKFNTENIKCSDMAAVRHTTVRVSELSLYP